MYISVPKNYGGSAFPRPDDAPAPHETPPHGFSHRSAPLPDFASQPQTARLAPASRPEPQRDCPPPPPRDSCDERELPERDKCEHDKREHDRCEHDKCEHDRCEPDRCEHECNHDKDGAGCGGDRCSKENKNPLTCLFEALRGRKKAGFDADDFLLIGLIALLMGKEGNEDIILILALLLLV